MIFRRQWETDYLHSLQRQYKWTHEESNINICDLVLMHNDCLPTTKWSHGRVIKRYPGKHGLVGSVQIQTASS